MLRALRPLAEEVAHALELGGVGALEGIDRLLGIAYGKDRAHGLGLRAPHTILVRTHAGEEIAGQPFDDAPLLRTGVLRLVDQQVIEAPVQLAQHPGDTALPPPHIWGDMGETL